MESTAPIPPLTFIVLNKPGDVADKRSAIASFAATSSWQQRQAGKPYVQPKENAQGFHTWRVAWLHQSMGVILIRARLEVL